MNSLTTAESQVLDQLYVQVRSQTLGNFCGWGHFNRPYAIPRFLMMSSTSKSGVSLARANARSSPEIDFLRCFCSLIQGEPDVYAMYGTYVCMYVCMCVRAYAQIYVDKGSTSDWRTF